MLPPNDVIIDVSLNNIGAIATREANQSQGAVGQSSRSNSGAQSKNELKQEANIVQNAVASNTKKIVIETPKGDGRPVDEFRLTVNASGLIASAGGIIGQNQGGASNPISSALEQEDDSAEISEEGQKQLTENEEVQENQDSSELKKDEGDITNLGDFKIRGLQNFIRPESVLTNPLTEVSNTGNTNLPDDLKPNLEILSVPSPPRSPLQFQLQPTSTSLGLRIPTTFNSSEEIESLSLGRVLPPLGLSTFVTPVLNNRPEESTGSNALEIPEDLKSHRPPRLPNFVSTSILQRNPITSSTGVFDRDFSPTIHSFDHSFTTARPLSQIPSLNFPNPIVSQRSPLIPFGIGIDLSESLLPPLQI